MKKEYKYIYIALNVKINTQNKCVYLQKEGLYKIYFSFNIFFFKLYEPVRKFKI